MSESRPITTPPRRRNNLLAHVQHVFNSGVGGGGAGSNSSSAAEASSASTSNGGEASTNGTIRKLESYHHALLESGCQSAKSSPLPHRRLDKLEGVIRDKPITPAISSMRRPFDCGDDNSGPSSRESSPALLRKRLNSNGAAAGCMPSNVIDHRFINNHQESPMPYRRQMQHQHHHHHHHHSANVADYKNAINKSSFRFDSGECKSMAQRRSSSPSPPPPLPMRKCYDSECCSAASLRPVALFRQHTTPGDVSPECTDDGRFGGRNLTKCTNVSSPAKGRLGEPGIFASPARSVCSVRNAHSPTLTDSNGFSTKSYAKFDCTDDINDDDAVVQPHADQSIVSGWLKFRDNKRVSAVTFESNFPLFKFPVFCFRCQMVFFLRLAIGRIGRCNLNELHCIASIVL